MLVAALAALECQQCRAQCAATLPILVMVRLACACTALIISLAPAMVMVNLMPVESCAEQQREQMMVAS